MSLKWIPCRHRLERTAMDLPCLSAKQKRAGLGYRLEEVRADVIMPVRPRPAAKHKPAIGVFVGAARRLDHAI
jgi:hypothetical protein